MEKRGLPYKVPELEYVEVENRPPPFDYYFLEPIVPCPQCGESFVRDPDRDGQGYPVPRNQFDPLDDDRGSFPCDRCLHAGLNRTLEESTLATIEQELGLTPKDRDALKSFIETIFTDPKKILKLQELDNRVSGLEKQNTALWVAFGVALTLLAIVAAIAVAGL